MFPTGTPGFKLTCASPQDLMAECEVRGESGKGGRGPTKQAAPPHTRQDAEADFLGGLIGGGDALSHSQKAMEFCRLRQPSTCRGGRGGGQPPRPEHRTHEQEKKKKNGEKKTEGSMHMKKERMKRHQEENAKTMNFVNEQKNMAG